MKTEMVSYCLYNRVFAEITTPIMKGAMFEDIAENMLNLFSFLFYILAHTKTIVKDSPLMGKNSIHIRSVLLQTLAQPCTRLQIRSLRLRISVMSI